MPYMNQSGVSSIPPALRVIIIINVICFIIQNAVPVVTEWGALHYWASPLFKPHQLITNMFLHGGVAHIFFNMYSLWIFGAILENYWGSKRFLNFYLICGIVAGIVAVLFVPFTSLQAAKMVMQTQPGEGTLQEWTDHFTMGWSAIGASGAVMGVMAGSAYIFPNRELLIWPIFIPVKVKYLVPFYVLADLFGGFGYSGNDNIAHFAHLGGAIIGFLIVFIQNKTNKRNFY